MVGSWADHHSPIRNSGAMALAGSKSAWNGYAVTEACSALQTDLRCQASHRAYV